jgi:hypothetical protein
MSWRTAGADGIAVAIDKGIVGVLVTFDVAKAHAQSAFRKFRKSATLRRNQVRRGVLRCLNQKSYEI